MLGSGREDLEMALRWVLQGGLSSSRAQPAPLSWGTWTCVCSYPELLLAF